MIRVYFAEREPEDVPANQCSVGAAGELILNEVELATVTDPQDIRRRVTTVTASTWRKTIGPAAKWLWAEPVSDESAVPDESAEDGERRRALDEGERRAALAELEEITR